MDACLYPRFLLPSVSSSGKPRLGKPFSSLKEIADGPSLFAARKDFSQLTVFSIRAGGNQKGRPSQKNAAPGRTTKKDTTQSSDGKSPNSANQEEIIALFRRIQSSISKGDSTINKRRSSNSSQDKPSAESVLEVLRQSRKQVKGEETSRGNRTLTRKRGGLLQKEKKVQEYPSEAEFKLTRPPSNFVKRSPIPFPSNPRKKAAEQTIETSAGETEFKIFEKMKLTELKEVAKTRGIRGYSKLKKRELVELLGSYT
ncbi:SAP-like protein BP-73 isoform X2 [Diospyros lotus]|uniref:SAP-like protein BP-73 isoform X2 n=1 Tax=Diospyros lotus TaxID=55363 RepID=UPI002257FC67|nr:SAP-like protein BP-73 isoform X2 [Diospyros lotus]